MPEKVEKSQEYWQDLVSQCPIVCEVAHPGKEDFEDAVGIGGLPCKRARLNYVPGTLTVEIEQWGWRFRHPGLQKGEVFVHALNGDTSPRYKGITIYQQK